MNQAIFEKIYVIDEDISRVELKQPFLGLFGDLLSAATSESLKDAFPGRQTKVVSGPAPVGSLNERTADLSLVGGSINAKLVELADSNRRPPGCDVPKLSEMRFD
ncbi:MAG: hypothetical protein JSS97_04640 [Actinobacteria bacterium]|nr:hypothetical protein [Actinomycetota bacterium]